MSARRIPPRRQTPRVVKGSRSVGELRGKAAKRNQIGLVTTTNTSPFQRRPREIREIHSRRRPRQDVFARAGM